MRIAVIGAGQVGRALGGNWAARGLAVRYGVTNPADPRHAGLGRVLPVADAAAEAELVLLATPWGAAEAACRTMGPLGGRILVDATNPLAMGPGGLGLEPGLATSGGETIAGWAAGARVFKSFNQTGFATMADPARLAPRPVMFVAGDDAAGKAAVLELVATTGFEPADAGPLSQARLLEALAMLWIDHAMRRAAGRDFAFALAR
jgi:hypothetical protein